MGFLFNKILKHAIIAIDKQNFGKDLAEYAYKKWNVGVAEKIIELLIDESANAKAKLEEIKKGKDEQKRENV